MSVICQTFIQNTWKKDLCSNCFKSLADHRYPNRERNRYFLHSATPYHTQQSWSGSQEWKYLLPSQNGDNNDRLWAIPKACTIARQDREERRSVTFLEEEPDVIGYGGEVYYLDGFADDWESDDGEFNLEKLDETDEDRAITKITKENTRFNTYISEKEIKKQSRYEPVYNRPVTRTDDTYESNNKRHGSNSDRHSSYESGNVYKAYYLPRVSITPYGTISNGLPLYGNKNNLEVQSIKKERQNSGDKEFIQETAIEKRRERPKSGDSATAKRNSNQDVLSQYHSMANGEEESNKKSVLTTANGLSNGSSIEHVPSFRSNSRMEMESGLPLNNSETNRIPNKVLEKCKEGINTVSGRQMKKNRESLEGFVLDEPSGNSNSYQLNECINTNIILNDALCPWGQDEATLSETEPLLEDKTVDDIDHSILHQNPPAAREESQQPLNNNETLNGNLCEENSGGSVKQNSDIADQIKANQASILPEHSEVPQHSLHYAVSAPISHNSPVNQYAESWIAMENSQVPGRHSANRESKLAALAVELEQARHSENNHRQDIDNNGKVDEPKDKSTNRSHKSSNEKEMIKEEPQKNKKSKFSLKKLLKRGKDTDSDTAASSKAWKSGDYDKSTLRLKIVHPMDMIEASGLGNPSLVDNGGDAGVSLHDTRTVGEESEVSNQPSKQEFMPVVTSSQSNSTLSRKKSERPSNPPPPPKCQRASSKRGVDFVDLTMPTKTVFQQNEEVKGQSDENPYDVPRNVIQKSDPANKQNGIKQETKFDTPSPPQTPPVLQNSKPAASDNEVIYDVARFPAKDSTRTNSYHEAKPELLNSGEIVNDASSIPESPQPNPDEAKKFPNPYAEPNNISNKQSQKAWITLEHSYAVVTAANHEVLAKFLDTAAEERCQQLWKPENTSLQWADFELAADSPVKILDDKVVIDATFRHGLRTDVTLLVTNQNLHPVPCGKGKSTYPVLGYFVDGFPQEIFSEKQLPVAVGAVSTVYILQRAEIDTFEGYCSSTSMDESLIAERTFITLQLIHLLKVLKSRNIQEVPDLCNTFLTRTDKEEMSKLVLLTDANPVSYGTEKVSLCQFALAVIKRIFQINPKEDSVNGLHNIPSNYRKIFSTVIRLLMQEKPFSLQQTQCFVEYALWGPTTVVQNCKKNLREMDVTLQRWLDTERAKCLRSVVRTLCRANVVTFLSSYDEYHADFLLRTSVRSLREVAMKS